MKEVTKQNYEKPYCELFLLPRPQCLLQEVSTDIEEFEPLEDGGVA